MDTRKPLHTSFARHQQCGLKHVFMGGKWAKNGQKLDKNGGNMDKKWTRYAHPWGFDKNCHAGCLDILRTNYILNDHDVGMRVDDRHIRLLVFSFAAMSGACVTRQFLAASSCVIALILLPGRYIIAIMAHLNVCEQKCMHCNCRKREAKACT
jgi:hypothetical protein